MKKFMVRYSVPFFVVGDVVYDADLHLLLTVVHLTHNPLLPIFKVLAVKDHYIPAFAIGSELPLFYSSSVIHLLYVCKKSTVSRFRRNYLPFVDYDSSPIFDFLRHFKALRPCEK